MAVKNKNRTEEDVRVTKIFGRKIDYEMFCVYWRYICTRINKNTVNRIEVG